MPDLKTTSSAISAALCAALMSHVYAQSPIFAVEGQANAPFPEQVASAPWLLGDLNNDGIPELGVPRGGHLREYTKGGMWLCSGYDGGRIFETRGPAGSKALSFGRSGGDAGDLDQDGTPDYLVQWENTYVLAYSGRTHAPLFHMHGALGDGFGAQILGSHDLDSDATSDFVIASPKHLDYPKTSGRIEAYSGKTRARLWRVDGTGIQKSLGIQMRWAGDLDNDGVMDIVTSSGLANQGRGYFATLSGKTGRILMQKDVVAIGRNTGTDVAVVGDVDDDGYPDIALSSPLHYDNGRVGAVELRSSKDGSTLSFRAGTLLAKYTGAIARTSDLDGDGVADLAAASLVQGQSNLIARVEFLSAKKQLRVIRTYDMSPQSRIGTMLGGADFNRDGVLDILIYDTIWSVPSRSNILRCLALSPITLSLSTERSAVRHSAPDPQVLDLDAGTEHGLS